MRRIAIIGTGYVGLVTGASLADFGHQVTCLDIDREKIEGLKQGNLPFFEPGLQELVERGIESGRLRFVNETAQALHQARYCFLALPTPSSTDHSCNLQYVLKAARSIAQHMSSPMVVINKSTVPVGTARQVKEVIEEEMSGRENTVPFAIVSNPEFLREGSAVRDFKQPQRILLGIDSAWAEEQMRQLYAPFADKLIITDIPSSELAKYAANAMLAMRLTMMNTFSELCEKLGGDIEAIKRVLATDPRIGNQYLSPGAGFGGSCLPKDVRALGAICRNVEHPSDIFDEILQINEAQKKAFLAKIINHYGSVHGKTLAVWGLSFKPDTDDLRESPSIDLCAQLLKLGARLRLFDPVALHKARRLLGEEPSYCDSEIQAATGSDGIILATAWKRFSYIDYETLGPLMRSKVLFDGRNQLIDLSLSELDFDYFPIGRASTRQVIYS